MEDESFRFNNIKQAIDELILERSKILLSKKLEKYKDEISNIYSQFNINKSRRIDALGSPQIDVSYLDQVIILILKQINLFLLELSSPKDIFISFFLITSQKENEMEGIIKSIQQEIISQNLTEKYNNLFFEERIKPLFIRYQNEIKMNNNNNDIGNDEIIHEINIVEYNSKGKIIKSNNELLQENENNLKKYDCNNNSQNKSVIIDKSINKNNTTNSISFNYGLGPNVLYIETLPQIIIDYLSENPNVSLVEIDEEFNKELKALNKKILYKIKEYDEIYSKNKNMEKNIKQVENELNKHNLQLKQVQKSIELYEQIIMDKKEKRENTIFLEDMLKKLTEKEREIINKIKEIKENSFVLNMQEKFNKYNNSMIKGYEDNNFTLMQNLDLSSSNHNKSRINANYNINNNNNNSINDMSIKEISNISLNYNKPNIPIVQNKNKIILNYKLTNRTNNINKTPIYNNINNKTKISNINNINYNKNALTTKNSILQTISSKEKDNQMFIEGKAKRKTATISFELTPDLINNALNEIFSFYSSLSNNNNFNTNINNNNSELDNNSYINYNTFKKFCIDFKIFIPENKIESIFYDLAFNNNDDNTNNKNIFEEDKNRITSIQFKSALGKLSLELHEIKKEKLKKLISDKKSVINYMELREYLRQEEEKNHNKFTEKITGGTAKKSLEKNQFEFLSKYKRLKSDITKFEFDYEKETKKNEQKILDDFYKFIGIGNDSYKNKIKLKTNIFVENALKKYGHMDIFKNYQNSNNSNISIATGFSHNNFNNNNTNKTNSLTMRITKKKLFPNFISNNKSIIMNNYNFLNNISSNQLNFKRVQNSFLDNKNIGNNRYNVKSIEDLEEVDNYKGIRRKMMNKNFSAVQLKGKAINKMNNINSYMNINILPSISNVNNNVNNRGYNNIRYNMNEENNHLEKNYIF